MLVWDRILLRQPKGEVAVAFLCDIIIALLIVLSAVVGRKRGLIKTAFSCLSLAVAIALSYFLGSYVGEYIKTTKAYDSLSLKAENVISERLDGIEAEGIAEAKQAKSRLEESELGMTLERLGLETDELYEKYEKAIDKGAENAKEKLSQAMADKVMSCLAKALGVLIVFVVSLIALKIISLVFDGIFKLPLLNSINRIGGLLLGIVLGVAGAFVLCMALEILMPYIPKNPVVYPGMEKDTLLYHFFVNLNPVILLLFG